MNSYTNNAKRDCHHKNHTLPQSQRYRPYGVEFPVSITKPTQKKLHLTSRTNMLQTQLYRSKSFPEVLPELTPKHYSTIPTSW